MCFSYEVFVYHITIIHNYLLLKIGTKQPLRATKAKLETPCIFSYQKSLDIIFPPRSAPPISKHSPHVPPSLRHFDFKFDICLKQNKTQGDTNSYHLLRQTLKPTILETNPTPTPPNTHTHNLTTSKDSNLTLFSHLYYKQKSHINKLKLTVVKERKRKRKIQKEATCL